VKLELNTCDSGLEKVEEPCEHCSEPSDSRKFRYFIGQRSNR